MGGICDCVDNAQWDETNVACGCLEGFYVNENSCLECPGINEDPLIQTETAAHIGGMCDCVEYAEWNSETQACGCFEGFYINEN